MTPISEFGVAYVLSDCCSSPFDWDDQKCGYLILYVIFAFCLTVTHLRKKNP